MSKLYSARIDVTKIPKEKIYKGQKGQYVECLIIINDEKDQFGNDGPIMVSQSKEERESGQSKVYLGNIKKIEPKTESIPVGSESDIADDDLPF